MTTMNEMLDFGFTFSIILIMESLLFLVFLEHALDYNSNSELNNNTAKLAILQNFFSKLMIKSFRFFDELFLTKKHKNTLIN